MPTRPLIEHRDPIRYLAIAGSGSGDAAFRSFADNVFGRIFGAASTLGATPVGAPFFRYYRFVPGGEFEVEVGLPIDRPVDGEPPADAFVAETPAGRYVTYVHEGAYSADDETWEGRDLPAAHRLIDTWAAEHGVRFATDGGSDRFTAVIEQYLVGPPMVEDVTRWRTLIAKLVAE